MNNLHLFQLINAPAVPAPWHLVLALLLARWLIVGLALALAVAWWRGDHVARRELLQAVVAVLLALALGQVVAHLWPMPRPFALHLGHQLLAHVADPGLPSDHVLVFWSLALALLRTRRFATWGFPLLALGLLVGWSRVYLGVHFPFDVLAALPVAAVAAVLAAWLRAPLMPVFARVLYFYDRWARRLAPHRAPPHQG